jgi:hypothetical protein
VRVFREEDPLLKVGVIITTLALALVIAAAVVSVALRSEPERVVAAEVATKSPGEPPRYSSGEEGSATKKSSRLGGAHPKEGRENAACSACQGGAISPVPIYEMAPSEKEPPRYPSGEGRSLGYDSSSSSGGPVGQREEEAKEEPQPVGRQEAEPPEVSVRNGSPGGAANTF